MYQCTERIRYIHTEGHFLCLFLLDRLAHRGNSRHSHLVSLRWLPFSVAPRLTSLFIKTYDKGVLVAEGALETPIWARDKADHFLKKTTKTIYGRCKEK